MVTRMVMHCWAAIALAMVFTTQVGKPVRIVSTTLVTDEIAAGLVDPSRIIALSRYAPDAETSNVSKAAATINRFVDRNAEQIVGLNPDVVLSTRYGKIQLKQLIRTAGIPYYELTQFRTVRDIEGNVRVIAKAVREETRGEEIIRDMQQKLEAAGRELRPERRAWRALYLAPGEWTAGTNTSVHEIFQHIGLRNAAAEAGINGNVKISLEKIIQSNPDVIVIGTGYERDANYSRYLSEDPRFAPIRAIQTKRIVAVPSRYIQTTSQFIGDAAIEIGRRIEALPR
jgi:iron complex transport system substrate-binding protein